MSRIERREILDYVTYSEQRQTIRQSAMRSKSVRRILVGQYFAFLFENRETVRYQIQEMMRVERLVKEADIEHEIKTYSELLHDEGAVGCTLLIGIDDEALRDEKLISWLGLNDSIYATLPNGNTVRPTWDPRQVGERRLSSVQYLRFEFGQDAPISIGISHPDVQAETKLSEAQRAALQQDLQSC